MNTTYLFNYPINENSYTISGLQTFQRLTPPDISRYLCQQIEDQVKSDLGGEVLPDRAVYEQKLHKQFVITPLKIDFEQRKKGASKEIPDRRRPDIMYGGFPPKVTVHECFVKYDCNNQDVLTLKHMLPTPQPGIWVQDEYFGFYCYEDNITDDFQKRVEWLQKAQGNINNMIQSINSSVTQKISDEISARYAKVSNASSVFDALGFSKMEEKIIEAPIMQQESRAMQGAPVIHNYGNMNMHTGSGNIAETHQIQNNELPIEKIKFLIIEIKECLQRDQSVSQSIRNEVNVQIVQLEQEIAKPNANPGMIKNMLAALASAGADAVGTALGTLLLSGISPLLLGH